MAVDAPIKPGDYTLPRSPADPERLVALAEQWNLAGATKRIVDALAS